MTTKQTNDNRVNLEQVCLWNSEKSRFLQFDIQKGKNWYSKRYVVSLMLIYDAVSLLGNPTVTVLLVSKPTITSTVFILVGFCLHFAFSSIFILYLDF